MPAKQGRQAHGLGWGIALVAYCGLIYWLSDQSRLPTPYLFDSQDKLLHAAAYAVMAWLFWQSWQQRLASRSHILLAATVLFCSLYGLSDEWHQSFVTGRHASVFDWLADTVGALLMALFMRKRLASAGAEALPGGKSR